MIALRYEAIDIGGRTPKTEVTMPLVPARAEQVLFGKLAPTLIEHIKAVPAREADGLVADVYAQMQRDFQLVPQSLLVLRGRARHSPRWFGRAEHR